MKDYFINAKCSLLPAGLAISDYVLKYFIGFIISVI